MLTALERVGELAAAGSVRVDVSAVPPRRLLGLAQHGLAGKATGLRRMSREHRLAVLVATVSVLGSRATDDVLELFDLLMTTELLSRAERESKDEKLRRYPRVSRNAGRLAEAVAVLLEMVEINQQVELSVVWDLIEEKVSGAELRSAVAIITELVPVGDAELDSQRAEELAGRFATVRPFLSISPICVRYPRCGECRPDRGSGPDSAGSGVGGGLVASVDGLRFVVPVRTIHARPNAKYFGRKRGITWLNMINDQAAGLAAQVLSGTPRDSLHAVDVVLRQQGGVVPEAIITDTGSYSDIVFGLLHLLGRQYRPQLANLPDQRLWRIYPSAGYGPLDKAARGRIDLDRIERHWEDMCRIAVSIHTGEVSAHEVTRMISRDGQPSSLGHAVAHFGRIFKSLHVLRLADDEPYRREIKAQADLTEGRHDLARRIFHGRRGEMTRTYYNGMEDQLEALGLVLNCVVLWNTVYMDRAMNELRAQDYPVLDSDAARLSVYPLSHRHRRPLQRPLTRPGWTTPSTARSGLPRRRMNDRPRRGADMSASFMASLIVVSGLGGLQCGQCRAKEGGGLVGDRVEGGLVGDLDHQLGVHGFDDDGVGVGPVAADHDVAGQQ